MDTNGVRGQMNTDGVAAAFELIVEEIEGVAQEIADLGSEAFKSKDYEKAQVLGESGKNLQVFRERVSALLEDWQAGIDIDTRKRFTATSKLEKKKEISSHSKARKTALRVALSSGKIIEEHFAADTFALTIQFFGIDRVRELGLTETGIPLIDSTKHAHRERR